MNEFEAVAAMGGSAGESDIPRLYTDFVAWLGVRLTPAQLVLAKVTYDGLEPRDLEGEERELARQIFGDVDVFPPDARWVLVAVCGARSGKTYALGALRVLHLALTVSLASMAPGEKAFGLIVAPDKKLARQAFDYVIGAIEVSPTLEAMVRSKTEERVVLQRSDGPVTIERLAASGKGTSLRGRSLVAALLDECAFFRDDNYQVNDAELFKATRPRLLPGGQALLTSTPWAEVGLLHEEFVENHPSPQCAAPHYIGKGAPTRAMAAHAPTMLMRNFVDNVRAVVDAERAKDPVNAAREFDAQFMSAATGQYFDAGSISRAVDPDLALGRQAAKRSAQAVGADPGFTSDSAASVAVEMTDDWVAVLDILELVPGEKPLKPTQVFAAMADMADRYGQLEIASDIHYAESAREAWGARGIGLVAIPGGQEGKGVMFSALRRRLNESTLKLPRHSKLLQQLREVVGKPTPGGGFSIVQPRRGKSGHGDLVSALVHANWLVERSMVPKDEPQLEGKHAEADAWIRDIERQEERAELERQAEESGMPFVPLDFDEESPPGWV